MLEINNGSVFCVCLLGGFVDSLAAFIEDYFPDEILMEASGMSDPVSIGQIFQSPKLRHRVYLGHAWTIVDALNFNKVLAIRSRLENQIRIADTVVINKTDLAGKDLDALVAAVKKINPYALVEQCSFARISFEKQGNRSGIFPSGESQESCRPDLQSVVIKSNRIIQPEGLETFAESVRDDFIRFKGYANTGIKQKTAVQGVFGNFTLSPVSWFPGPTELVGIGHLRETINYTGKFEGYCS
jgi:G3E family GTPase